MKVLTAFRCVVMLGGLAFGSATFAGVTVWQVIMFPVEFTQPFDGKEVALIDTDIVRKGDQIGYWMQIVDTTKLLAGIRTKDALATKNFYKQFDRAIAAKSWPRLFNEQIEEGFFDDKERAAWALNVYLSMEIGAKTLSYDAKLITYTEINCADRSVRATAVQVLDKSIGGYGSSNFPNAAFGPIPPNSIADKARRWFCK